MDLRKLIPIAHGGSAMLDSQIDFLDMESPAFRQQVKEFVDEITQLCPSDSAVRASFHFIQDRFLAEVKVASETVYMTAKAQAGAVNEVLAAVKANLMSQIVDWRNHRFAC